MRPVSADEFAVKWHSDALVRLPAEHASAAIPAEACAFLVRAGLPALVTCHEGHSEIKITFCRLASSLSTVLDEETVGPPLPSNWSVYWMLGDEFFCNGSAWWCIHQENGYIVRIDIELKEPIEFANTTVAHFCSALLAVITWSSERKRDMATWPRDVDRLAGEIQAIDPLAMTSDNNYWPRYLRFIREEEPCQGGFTKGSLASGRRSWKAGPW